MAVLSLLPSSEHSERSDGIKGADSLLPRTNIQCRNDPRAIAARLQAKHLARQGRTIVTLAKCVR